MIIPACDMHTHTVFSFDGRVLPFDLCSDAVKEGVAVLAITEHYDFFTDRKYNYYNRFRKERLESVERMKGLFGGRLKILNGIELGQPHYDMDDYGKVMAADDYDVVIGSIHDLRRTPSSIYDMKYRDQADCDSVFEEYFHEMNLMVDSCDFDILAHLDYPIRVMDGAFKAKPDLSGYKSLIVPILEKCVEKNIALEVNTAGTRKWINSPGPALWILKEYRRLGGGMLTMGSDAHRKGHCAWRFSEAFELIKEAGFDRTVYFEKRQPHFIMQDQEV